MIELLDVAMVVAGLALLVWSADRFVFGAAGLARTLGVSPLIIGMVIVGFGTSAPEMLVGGIAAWNGNTELAIGNAIGSNIANIALVLGATALIIPLAVHSAVLKRELPVLMLVMALVVMLLSDGELGFMDGIILLLGLVTFIYWMIHLAKTGEEDTLAAEFQEEIPDNVPLGKALFWVIVGLLLLLGGARLVVDGSVNIARALGVSDLVIGLTIIAIGTSLPELAATIASARKGEDDMAIGNIVGSNMFNMLGVLGIPAVINPTIFDPNVMRRDIPVMLFFTLLLFLLARGWGKREPHISRWQGGLLLLGFFVYLGTLYYMSVDTSAA